MPTVRLGLRSIGRPRLSIKDLLCILVSALSIRTVRALIDLAEEFTLRISILILFLLFVGLLSTTETLFLALLKILLGFFPCVLRIAAILSLLDSFRNWSVGLLLVKERWLFLIIALTGTPARA